MSKYTLPIAAALIALYSIVSPVQADTFKADKPQFKKQTQKDMVYQQAVTEYLSNLDYFTQNFIGDAFSIGIRFYRILKEGGQKKLKNSGINLTESELEQAVGFYLIKPKKVSELCESVKQNIDKISRMRGVYQIQGIFPEKYKRKVLRELKKLPLQEILERIEILERANKIRGKRNSKGFDFSVNVCGANLDHRDGNTRFSFEPYLFSANLASWHLHDTNGNYGFLGISSNGQPINNPEDAQHETGGFTPGEDSGDDKGSF